MSLALALVLAACALFIAYRVGFFRLTPTGERPRLRIWHVLGVFLGYFVLMLFHVGLFRFFSDTPPAQFSQVELLWFQITFLVVVFAFLGLYLAVFGSARRAIMWGKGVWRDLGIGSLTWLVSYPTMLFASQASGLVTEWIWGRRGVEQVAVKQLEVAKGHPWLFALLAFLVIVVVPFSEELLFRGFLQTYLRRFIGRLGGLFSTGLLFALVHFSWKQGTGNLELIVSLLVLSCFLGFLYERQQSLWAPIGLHAMFNALSVLQIAF